MSETKLATKADLKEMYDRILPYMGGIVSSKAGFTPIGTIISVMGTTAPVNYLACDGTVYNIADYTELANYFNEQFGSKNFFGGDGTTTFAVPDLRGEFLRGTGTNSHANQGSGAAVGVHQDGTKHLRLQTANNSLYTAGSGSTSDLYDYRNNGSTQLYGHLTSGAAEGFEQTFTSRPTNTSVLYCIATKNFYIDPTLDYSTDEKIVGTWIDGKTLYQKTIVQPLPEITHTTARYVYGYSELISDLDDLVNVSMACTLKYSTNPIYSISGNSYNSDGTLGSFTYAAYNHETHMMAFYLYTSAAHTNTSVIATIQYTKTTS